MFKNTSKLLIFTAFSLAIVCLFVRRKKRNVREHQNINSGVNEAIKRFSASNGFSQIKHTTILIPSHNEYKNLCELLPRIPKSACGHELGVLIIDDGSTDQTADLPLHHDVAVVSTELKRGQGAALRLGYALALAGGAKVVVTLDGDGQYRPEEIEGVLAPVIAGEYDFVIGSRILGGFETDDSFRLLGVHFYARILSTLLGLKLTDSSSGFRAIRASYLEMIIDRLVQPQYQSGEVLLELAKAGARISEAPIVMLKRQSGKSKKGNNFYYGFAYARTILLTWFKGNVHNETIKIPLPVTRSETDFSPTDRIAGGNGTGG